MSQDTYPMDGFNPSTIHRYSYAWNNPINMTDPSGNSPSRCEIKAWFKKALERARVLGEEASELIGDGLVALEDVSLFLATNPMADGTPLPIDQTLGVLGLGVVNGTKDITTFWQYYTKGTKYISKWFVKGKGLKPPHKTGSAARKALNLPPHNKASAVRPYYPDNLVGPRHPSAQKQWGWSNKGKGWEYCDANDFPD